MPVDQIGTFCCNSLLALIVDVSELVLASIVSIVATNLDEIDVLIESGAEIARQRLIGKVNRGIGENREAVVIARHREAKHWSNVDIDALRRNELLAGKISQANSQVSLFLCEVVDNVVILIRGGQIGLVVNGAQSSGGVDVMQGSAKSKVIRPLKSDRAAEKILRQRLQLRCRLNPRQFRVMDVQQPIDGLLRVRKPVRHNRAPK